MAFRCSHVNRGQASTRTLRCQLVRGICRCLKQCLDDGDVAATGSQRKGPGAIIISLGRGHLG